MGSVSETLRLLVSMDASQAISEMDKIERQAGRTGTATESKLDRVGAGMTRMGAAAVAGGLVVAAGLAVAGQKAIELSDAIAGNNRVFGDAIGTIDDYAASAAESVGMSETAFRQQANVIGGMLGNLGFTQQEAAETSAKLTTVAADLAAAFGKDPQDAIMAIGSLLRGERDPIEQFAIGIKEVDVQARVAAAGLDTSTSAAAKNSAAVASLEILLEQAAAQQGAFGESAASAGQIASAKFEDFQAQLGEEVLPIITGVTDAASGMLDGFSALDGATGGLTSKFATWGTGLVIVAGLASTVIGKVIQMRDNFGALSGRLGPVTKGIGLAAGAIGAGVLIYDLWSSSMENANRTATELHDAIVGGVAPVEALNDKISEMITNDDGFSNLADSLGLGLEDIALQARATEDEWESMKDVLFAEAPDTDLAVAWIRDMDRLRSGFRGGREDALALEDAQADLDAQTAELGDSLDGATESVQSAAQEEQALAEKTKAAADAANDAAAAYEAAQQKLEEYRAEVRGATDNKLAFRDAIRETRTKLQEYGKAEGDLTDVHSAASIAYDDLLASVLDQAEAYAEVKAAGQGVIAKTDAQITKLRELKNMLPAELRPQIQAYIDDLNRIPRDVNTRVTINGVTPPAGNVPFNRNPNNLPEPETAGIGDIAPMRGGVGAQPSDASNNTVVINGDVFTGKAVATMLQEVSYRSNIDLRVEGSTVTR